MDKEQNPLLLLVRAISVAVEAHGDTMSQDGTPYILHPLRLMMKANTLAEKIVAILHDTVEDTPVTIEALSEWLPDYIVDSIDTLTRRPGENYDNYISIVSRDRIATTVKLLDLYDNIDLTRLTEVGQYQLERAAKYHRAIKTLEAHQQGYQ